MKVNVVHSKRLTSSQFNATKGSNIHSVMVMNRVIINFKTKPKSQMSVENCAFNFDLVANYLITSCTNFFFISDKPLDDYSLCYYFLSKADMEDFMVWAKLSLPRDDPEQD